MSVRERLTERQNQVFEFLRAHARDAGRPPTLAEVGQHLGLRSSNGVHKLLVALEAKGYISRVRHEARGITILDDDDPALRFDDGPPSVFMPRSVTSSVAQRPLARGRQPVLVEPRILPRGLDLDTCLALVVGDDGMNGDGIRKSDLVVVEEADWEDVAKGAAVAVLFDDRVAVRRLEVANGRLHFRASDKTYRDESFDPGDDRCYVVGPVRALMRRL
ncbi:MAG TPA: S24 family peptidase [Rubricoccaceae bacterium]|jgi:repressor LexA